MRKFRKLAAELKEAASGRQGPTPTPARSRAKKENASPVKKGELSCYLACTRY